MKLLIFPFLYQKVKIQRIEEELIIDQYKNQSYECVAALGEILTEIKDYTI